MKPITTLVALILAGAWAASPVLAGQTKAGDDKVFGDWVLHCAKTSAAEEACALHQKIISRETKLSVAAVSIARGKDSQELRFAVILPLGLDIPFGVAGKAGDSPLTFQVQTCVRRGCIVTSQIDHKLLEALHGSRFFMTTFKIRGVANPITLAVSNNGLDEGLKALKSK